LKLNTLRNVMLSMLVLGVAGSVVGMGSGTFAVFNAQTTSTGNTFSTASITFSNTVSGGGTCTSTAGAPATGTCTATLTRSTMVAGDSKLGTTTLTNGGNAGVTVQVVITDSGSDTISTTGIGAAKSTAVSDALGLLIFECLDGTGADIACSSASVASLYTVYGSCGASGSPATFATVTQAGAFSSSFVTTNNGLSDNGIKVGTGTNGYCYGGNTGAGIKGLSVPIVASSSSPTVAGANSLATSKTDNLAIIVYLPTTADNSAQAKTATSYTLTYTATQLAGTST
jgi:hypothetical protein